jgi:hypothetical protein
MYSAFSRAPGWVRVAYRSTLAVGKDQRMASPTGPADGTDDDGAVGDWSPETVAAIFRASESAEADVSPQLARSVQATINTVKHIGREFGFLTESETLDAVGQENEEALDFTLRYRGQTLYPRFLFEPSPGGAGPMRVRPLMKDLKNIADEHGWNGADVVLWMASPTTWFADGGRPVEHLEEPARILAAFEDEAEGTW